jgi:hypothetical protein
MTDTFRRRLLPRTALLLVSACTLLAPGSGAAEPALADELVGAAGFPRAEIESLGEAPLVRDLAVDDPGREAALAGIVRLRSDGAGLAAALASPERAPLAKGVHARGRFHDPVQPGDVSGIEFAPDELEALADCAAAACKFKVGRRGLDGLAAIDWSRPEAGDEFTARFRSEALAYVDGYRKQGNASLALYADKPEPSALGTVIEALVADFPGFARRAPGFTKYLLSYPAGRPPGTSDAIVWQIADFGYRPTLVIDHLVVDRDTEVAGAPVLAAAKTIYANHYLAGRIQMGAVVDGAAALGAPGHFLVLIDRIAFDDELTGFKRKLLSGGLRDSLVARLAYLRALADGG